MISNRDNTPRPPSKDTAASLLCTVSLLCTLPLKVFCTLLFTGFLSVLFPTPSRAQQPSANLPGSSSSGSVSNSTSAAASGASAASSSDEALKAAQSIQTLPVSTSTTAPSAGPSTPPVASPATLLAPGALAPGGSQQSGSGLQQGGGQQNSAAGAELGPDGKPLVAVVNYSLIDTICKRRLPDLTAQKSSPPQATEDGKVKIESLKAEVRKDPTNLRPVVTLAKEFFTQGDFEKTALLLWKQVSRLESQDLSLLADAHERLSQPKELRKVAELLIGKNEKSSEAYYYLALSYNQATERNQLLYKQNLEKSLEFDPKNRRAIKALADFYMAEGNFYEAKSLYSDSLKLVKNDPDWLAAACEVNSLDSSHNETRELCPLAIKADSIRAENYIYLGISYKETDDWNQAQKYFKEAIEKFPGSEFAHICYAETLQKKKDPVAAYEELKLAHTARPDSERAELAYAKAAFEIKKLDESLKSFSNLCRKNKKYGVELRRVIQDLRKSAQKNETARFENELRRCGFY